VRGAAANAAEAGWLLSSERVETLVLGTVPSADRLALDALVELHDCTLVQADDALVAEMTVLAAEPAPLGRAYANLAARSKFLGLDQRATETLVLGEWLPPLIKRMRRLLPPLVDVVVIVEPGTPPVCCVPDVLEHVVIDLVTNACTAIPWGGIVWLTGAPGRDGEVKLDVLENGAGHVRDLTLLASPAPVA
jgi:hypothetical protein